MKIMIRAEKLSYGYPQKELYKDVNFHIEMGQHCALIGLSGSGKSSLVDMILDHEEYMYTGKLHIRENARIAYVSQFPRIDDKDDMNVYDYISSEFRQMQSHIDLLCEKMATGEDMETVFDEYQEAIDTFEGLGGNNYESTINKQLQLADLMKYADLPIANLSGGEFKLVQVIKEMLVMPDLLIMDEPDVFLDFENQNALKQLINNHKGTVLVITHSRFLLNHCFNKILHLEDQDIRDFEGTYIDYNFSLLEEKIDLQERAVADTLEIERNNIIIDSLRTRASYDADAARGRALGARVKIQERLMARRTEHPFIYVDQPEISLITESPISEGNALEIKDLAIAYDSELLKDISFNIEAGEKVALVGANGTGKTSLLRMIRENNSPEIILHDEMDLGYLSQNQSEVLKLDNNIFDEFFDLGFETYDQIREYVKAYGFEGEVLEQRVSSLSGGEKNILQLAKISTSNANFLLLDEPTSHLDIYTQLRLEDALKDYNGGFIMISHDFYSIINCVDRVLVVRDNGIHDIKMKKFKQNIYNRYFNKNYLELEEEKKALEMQIEELLTAHQFDDCRSVVDKLEYVISKMK